MGEAGENGMLSWVRRRVSAGRAAGDPFQIQVESWELNRREGGKDKHY